MTVADELEIRPGTDADLPALVSALGQQRWFSDRLARQRAGGGVLLLAWLEGRSVGDVYLHLDPATEPEVRQHLPGVPLLIHLEVLEPFQRRGIGTALIHAGEDTARHLGHRQLDGRSWTTQPLPSGSLKNTNEFQRPPGPSTRLGPS